MWKMKEKSIFIKTWCSILSTDTSILLLLFQQQDKPGLFYLLWSVIQNDAPSIRKDDSLILTIFLWSAIQNDAPTHFWNVIEQESAHYLNCLLSQLRTCRSPYSGSIHGVQFILSDFAWQARPLWIYLTGGFCSSDRKFSVAFLQIPFMTDSFYFR